MERLRVPASLDSLEPLRRFVSAATERAGIERRAAYKLMTAIDELATNIILYGYQDAGREGDVAIASDMTEAELTITLRDRALPFNPLERETPSHITASLEDRPIGGLGIHLAVQGVDRFEYVYENGENINRLSVHRPQGAGGA